MKRLDWMIAAVGAASLIAGCAAISDRGDAPAVEAEAPNLAQDAAAPLDPVTADSGFPLTERDAAIDVRHYALTLTVDPDARTLAGTAEVRLRTVQDLDAIELDLDPRFDVATALVNGEPAALERAGPLVVVTPAAPLAAGTEATVSLEYAGAPHVAIRAPWDGGFVFARTLFGEHHIGLAVQGQGCDLWFPCKDHVSDEPDDGARLTISVPAGLRVASNGRLISETTMDGLTTAVWETERSINPYLINITIAPFERITDVYTGVLGTDIPIEFWVLPENAPAARRLIENDLLPQLAWLEATVGPYPWGEEKIGVVDTPYLGMEHQTINAYGAGYRVNQHGYDWLLLHELAHEWFGNLMSHAEERDIWLHEAFATYVEPLYAGHVTGPMAEAHDFYTARLRAQNCTPIVQPGHPTGASAYSSDIYSKGAWVLRTMRFVMGDTAFWNAVRTLVYDTDDPYALSYPIAETQRSSEDFLAIAETAAGYDLDWFFDAYVYTAALPELVVTETPAGVDLAWVRDGEAIAFPMPVPVAVITGAGEREARRVIAMPGGRASVRLGHAQHLRIDPDMEILRAQPITPVPDCGGD